MATPLSIDSLNLTSLKRKSALITGGAFGLGLETALLLARSGAYVTVADIQPSEPTIKIFKSYSLAVQYVRCDVTDWSQQVVAFKQAVNFAPTRSLDIVCCFAGIDYNINLVEDAVKTESSVDDEPTLPDTQELDTNLKGTVYSANLALHYFGLTSRRKKKVKKPRRHSISASDSDSGSDKDKEKKAKEVEAETKLPDPVEHILEKPTKSLIFVSSMSGYIHDPHNSIYSASNFGIRGLFSTIAKEASKQLNVRCNLIAPWSTRTPMTIPILERLEKAGHLKREEPEDKGKRVETVSMDADDPQEATVNDLKIEQVSDVQEDADGKSEEIAQVVMSGALNDEAETTTTADTTTSESLNVAPVENLQSQPSEEPNGNTSNIEQTPNPDSNQSDSQAESSSTITAEPQIDIPPPAESEVKTEPEERDTPPSIPNPESIQEPETNPEIKYTGISFAKSSDVANAVAKCCVDTTLSGRAIAIMPEGIFDLCDDIEGGYGGDVLRQLMTTRKEAGDLLTG